MQTRKQERYMKVLYIYISLISTWFFGIVGYHPHQNPMTSCNPGNQNVWQDMQRGRGRGGGTSKGGRNAEKTHQLRLVICKVFLYIQTGVVWDF